MVDGTDIEEIDDLRATLVRCGCHVDGMEIEDVELGANDKRLWLNLYLPKRDSLLGESATFTCAVDNDGQSDELQVALNGLRNALAYAEDYEMEHEANALKRLSLALVAGAPQDHRGESKYTWSRE